MNERFVRIITNKAIRRALLVVITTAVGALWVLPQDSFEFLATVLAP